MNPYSPSSTTPSDGESSNRVTSARRAFLSNCRNGFLWSLAVMLPLSLLAVPAIPRRMPRDDGGNFIPYLESVGYAGMMQEAFGILASASLVWTLSAGVAGLIRYYRIRATTEPPL